MENAERAVMKLITKAIHEYRMIEEGDRIVVAVSGGKDSTVLARDLALRRAHSSARFELLAVHVSTEFGPDLDRLGLTDLFRRWDIPFASIAIDVGGRLKEGQEMNCWWCSTQRRSELQKFAEREGFNKLALGHHLDDLLETLFMNMTQKGEFSTMPPVMAYRKFPLTVIRPLALTEERQIVACAAELGLDSVTCTCGYGADSGRKKMRARIEAFTSGSSAVKRRIFASMGNVRADYLA